jgi:hypothetical protein
MHVSCVMHKVDVLTDLPKLLFVNLSVCNLATSTVPENSTMCTFDVTSLYTNIPHQGSQEALMFYLNVRPPNALPITNCMVDLAELAIPSNYCLFRGDFFLQTKGTTMGSTMFLFILTCI